MKKILSFLNDNLEKMICASIILIMTAIIFVQVISRRLLNNSLSWSEEIARYLFLWLCYIGAAYGVKERKHISVEAFTSWLPKKGQFIIQIVANFLFLAFAIYLLRASYNNTTSVIASGKLSPATQLPLGYIYNASLFFGYVLVSFRLVQALIQDCITLKNWNENLEEE